MPSEDLALKPSTSALFIVDVQEKLGAAMNADLYRRVLENLHRLGHAAGLLGVPVIISEQYPKGLGHTVTEVREAFPHALVLHKTSFDALGERTIAEAVKTLERSRIVVAGMEAHICVYQTVRSLSRDHHVQVIRDAVASRTMENFEVGLDLSRASGATITSTETVLFDWLGVAGTEEFKAISKLVR
jgi:nicotinamidase-related amidase